MNTQTARAREREPLIDAKAAIALLGIKPQTLYAYVSRGLIRSAGGPGSKTKLYYRQDIENLQLRGRTLQANRNAAQRALRIGGNAALQSSITSIGPQGPSYRGHLAIDLALAGRSFEEVVELLWSGVLPRHPIYWAPQPPPEGYRSFAKAIAATAAANNSRRLFSLCTEALASCAGMNGEFKAGASVLAARQIIQVLASAFGYLRARPAFEMQRAGEPLSQTLCRSMDIEPKPDVLSMLDAALLICADHELAPSTFAARIAASTGADIYSCVSSALGAFEGIHTGLGCDLAEETLREASSPAKYVEGLRAVTLRKQPLPGYSHPVYPQGDPRARFLLGMIRSSVNGNRRADLALACVRAAEEKLEASPSLSVALAVLAVALNLPPRTPGALMALSRSAGWIAHTFEQRLAGFLVRPRAEYVGSTG